MFRSSLLLLALSSLLPSSWCQLVPTPANIVCYQEVVASNGSYAQIDASLKTWSQKLYNTLNLTGPIELSVGWARVPDRTGFENNCTGPYPNIADLFVHIQTNTTAFDSVSSALESFIASNRMTSQPNIVCSARSIITFLPGCGKVTGGAGLNNGTTFAPPTNATNSTTSAPTNSTTSAPTNSTTSAPTNSTSSNSTIAPTLLPTLVPSNATGGVPPSNATEAPTNATESSSTASSSNSTTNSTLSTSSTSISSNTTTGNSSEASNTTIITSPVGGAATQDASATGGVSANGAYTTTIAAGTIGVVLLSSTISIML